MGTIKKGGLRHGTTPQKGGGDLRHEHNPKKGGLKARARVEIGGS